MPTKKQRWVSERCFRNYGHLKGMTTRLRQIAKDKSTTVKEAEELNVIAAKLGNLAIIWNSPQAKVMSKRLYMVL